MLSESKTFIRGWAKVRPNSFLSLVRNKELYKADSYYPECVEKQRGSRQVFADQCRTIWKWGYPNKYYFSYGFDVKTREEQDRYVHFETFFRRICLLNQSPNINCCCILRDKILFNIYANGIGVITPPNVLYSANGHLYDYESKKEIGAQQLLNYGNISLFCKLVEGECGRGIFKLEITDGKIYEGEKQITETEAYKMLTQGRYLAQFTIRQHPLLTSLHPQSINSLRIVTVRSLKDGIIRVWPSILRIGTGKSIVDNTSQGGLCVGINFENNHLKKWGFYKPQFGRKVDRHPDSDIVFADFELPFLKEAQEQAVYFHSLLPGMQSVGWDIAIGEDGPVFIEGNDNWEINGPQICNGGLRKLFEEQMFE